MQLKLFNFYNILSTFSTNIVGAFIAMIIYKSTNNFTIAFIYLVSAVLLRVIINQVLYKPSKKDHNYFYC